MGRSEHKALEAGSRRPERDAPGDPRPGPRGHDPERTRRDILDVATEEFAARGFSGARVDVIAERTRTSKRMIYYYFGGKEGLYSTLEKGTGAARRRYAPRPGADCPIAARCGT